MATPIAQALTKFQRRRGLTAAQLADLLDMHRNGLAKILDGRAVPSGQTIGRMARLGVRVTPAMLRSL